MKIEHFIESLCISYLLYHCFLGNQTGCADLLFLFAKQSTKSGHLLTVTLSLSVSLGTQQGRGCILPHKATDLVKNWRCRNYCYY